MLPEAILRVPRPLSDDGAIFVTPSNKVPLIPAHQFKVGFDVEVLPRWRVGRACRKLFPADGRAMRERSTAHLLVACLGPQTI